MRYFLYIMPLVILLSCNSVGKPKKPDNLIAPDKMANIMHDLYILNGARGINRKILELNGVPPLVYIYDKYDIDSLQFAESNTYYAYDIETYKAIIEKVRIDLDAEKILYDTEAPKRKSVEEEGRLPN